MSYLLLIFGAWWLRCCVQPTTLSKPAITKLVRGAIPKSRPKNDKRKRKVDFVRCGLCTHQHTFFSKRVSAVHFWRQRSCDQDDHQRTKSSNETRVKNPQSCAWLAVRQNQFGTQDPYQKPTRRHPYQSEFHPWQMESSSSFMQHNEFLDFALAAISANFLQIRSCQREVKKRLPVKVYRWRNPNHWFQRRRDPSTWCCAARGARGEILRRLWDIRSIRGNVDDGQGSQTSTMRLVRTTQSPEVECSQVMQQENAQNSDSRKQGDKEKFSNSTSSRRLVRAATPRTEFQNMKYTNHQYMTKVFHFLQKKLRITAAQHSQWKHLRQMCWYGECSCLRPNYLVNLEVYKNTNFEDIESLFNITQKLILEHSEETLNVNTIESASPSWTRSVLSHDQVIQWTKAEVRVYSDSVLCLVKMNDSKDAITRWEGQEEAFIMSPSYKEMLGIDGESIEFEWNILPGFSSLQILQKIQDDLWEWNIEPGKFADGIFMSMFNDMETIEFVSRIQKRSSNTRKDSCRDIGRSSALETKRSGMDDHSIMPRIRPSRQQFLEDNYWTKHWIPPHIETERTSHVMISRGKSRFVDEGHIRNAELRSSAELLNYSLNFRKQKEENLVWHSRRQASRRLVRPMLQVRQGSRKLVRTLSPFLLAKRPFSHTEPSIRREEVERNSCQNIVWRSSVNSGLQNGSTLVERQLRLSWWGTFWFLTIGMSFFTGVVLSAFNLSLRTDWFRVERKAREDDRLSSSHHLIL